MNLIIKISLGNAAFEDDLEAELEKIFEQIYWHIDKHPVSKVVRSSKSNLQDSNGNTVGSVEAE